MHTVHAVFHDSFARLSPASSTQNPTSLAKTQESICLSCSTQSHDRNQRLIGHILFSSFFNNFGLLNKSGMHSCCQHKVESFSYSAIVELLRAVWNSLQRLLCCCSCVKIGWFSITQFLCKTDTWVLNPKSNNFGQNARIDVLVIFNSSYCRLVGQVLFYFFSTALGFWTSLEICNIFKGATSCWQEQHKVESFSSNSSGIVDLLRAVWHALQRLLCCCSCVKIGWFSITQFLCKTDTWVLNPKSNKFGQNARIDLLVIFNSSYCRLVGQVLFYFFQQLWASERVWNAFLLSAQGGIIQL